MPGNVPVAMTVVNPTTNTEVKRIPGNFPNKIDNSELQVIPMQETLEVRLKESTYQVVSDWPFAVKMENMESSDSYNDCKPMQVNTKLQTQHPMYSTASQASQHFMYLKSICFFRRFPRFHAQ